MHKVITGATLLLALASMILHHEQTRRLDALEQSIDALWSSSSTRTHMLLVGQQENTRRLDELQNWREIITLASRMGWGAANRYIASQVHELGEVEE